MTWRRWYRPWPKPTTYMYNNRCRTSFNGNLWVRTLWVLSIRAPLLRFPPFSRPFPNPFWSPFPIQFSWSCYVLINRLLPVDIYSSPFENDRRRDRGHLARSRYTFQITDVQSRWYPCTQGLSRFATIPPHWRANSDPASRFPNQIPCMVTNRKEKVENKWYKLLQ